MACDVAWASRDLECPACHQTITIPHTSDGGSRPAPVTPRQEVREPVPATGPKLAAGATQIRRSSLAPAPLRKHGATKSGDEIRRRGGSFVVGIVCAVKFLPGLLDQVAESGPSKPSSSRPGSAAASGGPLAKSMRPWTHPTRWIAGVRPRAHGLRKR